MTKAFGVILGSVRAERVCPSIAEWVAKLGRKTDDVEVTLIDLRERYLPMDDEPNIPARDQGYLQPHTQAWAEEIVNIDALVFVTPQYNGGIPAPLKNAIDHLCHEWEGKPVLIVTYGIQGGTKCAEQLRQLALSLKMLPAVTAPAITLPKNLTVPVDLDTDFAEYADSVHAGFNELRRLAFTT